MLLRWAIAAGHLLALGVGLGAVWARGRALRGPLSPDALRRVFVADTWWGVAAALWIVTGVWRAFGGLEKGTAYYLAHPLFHVKLGLFLLIFLLELAPMANLIVWRRQVARGQMPATDRARHYARISLIQAVLLIAIVVCAVGIARDYGI